ncbi:hypothetical protein PT286_03800 [Neisseriaceae bacterium ESL0693]|nr:hypothetical protein [Neisseriaceae bacterium ESL0693]
MQGKILDFSISTNTGFISGNDNARYRFKGNAWREQVNPEKNMLVDFDIDQISGEAIDIFICEPKQQHDTQTSKISNGKIGYAITSLFCSIFCLLVTFGGYEFNQNDRDLTNGFILFMVIAIVTAIITLKNKYDGNKMAISSLIICAIALLMAIP